MGNRVRINHFISSIVAALYIISGLIFAAIIAVFSKSLNSRHSQAIVFAILVVLPICFAVIILVFANIGTKVFAKDKFKKAGYRVCMCISNYFILMTGLMYVAEIRDIVVMGIIGIIVTIASICGFILTFRAGKTN